MEIQQTVVEILAEHLRIEKDRIENDSSVVDDLGGDSLDIVEIIMVIEDEFNIEVPEELAEKVTTVDDIVELATKLKHK